MRLGRIGIWRRYQPGPGIVPELEALGYGTLWLGSSPSLDDARAYLEASEEITIATGILNIWQHDPADVAGQHLRAEQRRTRGASCSASASGTRRRRATTRAR